MTIIVPFNIGNPDLIMTLAAVVIGSVLLARWLMPNRNL